MWGEEGSALKNFISNQEGVGVCGNVVRGAFPFLSVLVVVVVDVVLFDSDGRLNK